MKNLFIDSNEIDMELKELEQNSADLSLKLSLLSQKITYLFSLIKNTDDQTLVNEYFSLIDHIQLTLAKLQHQYEIGLPERLNRFVQDFDNLEIDREYYQNKIKNGDYSF